MAFSFTISTYGMGNTLDTVLSGVAMITDLTQQPQMASMMKIGLLVGLVYAVIRAIGGSGQSAMSPLKSLLISVIAISVIMGTRANVTIVDQWGSTSSATMAAHGMPTVINTINGVPLILALVTEFYSDMDGFLTKTSDTVFGTAPMAQLGGKYTDNGFMAGLNMVNAISSINVQKARSRRLLDLYWKKCVTTVAARHNAAYLDGLRKDDLITTMDIRRIDPMLNPLITYKDSNNKYITSSCSVLYTQVKNEFDTKVGPNAITRLSKENGMPVLAIKNMLTKLSSGAMSVARSAANIAALREVQSEGYLTTSGMMSKAGMTSAEQSKAFFEAGMKISASIGRDVLPVVREVMVAVLIALFPVVVLLLALPGGVIAIVSFGKTFVWLALWGPIMVVLNAISAIAQNAVIGGMQANQAVTGLLPLSPVGLPSLVEYNNIVMGVVGLLSLSVPRLAYMLLSKGEVIANGIAEAFARPTSQDASQLAHGNVSYADQSVHNLGSNNIRTGTHSEDGYAHGGAFQTNANRSVASDVGINDERTTHQVYGDKFNASQSASVSRVKSAIRQISSSNEYQELVDTISHNGVLGSISKAINQHGGFQDVFNQLSQYTSMEDLNRGIEKGEVNTARLSAALEASSSGAGSAAMMMGSGLMAASGMGLLGGGGAGGGYKVTAKGKQALSSMGGAFKNLHGNKAVAALGALALASGVAAKVLPGSEGSAADISRTKGHRTTQTASLATQSESGTKTVLDAGTDALKKKMAQVEQSVAENESTGSHKTGGSNHSNAKSFKTEGNRAATDLAEFQRAFATESGVSNQTRTGIGASRSLTLTRIPGQNPFAGEGFKIARERMQEALYSTEAGSSDRVEVEAALSRMNALEARRVGGLIDPESAVDNGGEYVLDRGDKKSLEINAGQNGVKKDLQTLTHKAGAPGNAVTQAKATAEIVKSRSDINKVKGGLIDRANFSQNEIHGTMYDVLSSFGVKDPNINTLAKNKKDGAMSLIQSVEGEYEHKSGAILGALKYGSQAKSRKVAGAITANMKSGRTGLASDQAKAFVDGYAIKKTLGWLSQHGGASQSQIDGQMKKNRIDGENILSSSLRAEGENVMEDYSKRLDGISAEAQKVFLNAEAKGGVGAGLDAVGAYVKKESQKLHDEYGDNKLLGHGAGMGQTQADFAVTSAAMSGVAGTVNEPDGYSGSGTIGDSLRGLSQHENSRLGIFERVGGAAAGSAVMSVLGDLGLVGAGKVAGYAKGRMGGDVGGSQAALFGEAGKSAGILSKIGKMAAMAGPAGRVAGATALLNQVVSAGMEGYFNNHNQMIHDIGAARPTDNRNSTSIASRNIANAGDVEGAPGIGQGEDAAPNGVDLAKQAFAGAKKEAGDVADAAGDGALELINRVLF